MLQCPWKVRTPPNRLDGYKAPPTSCSPSFAPLHVGGQGSGHFEGLAYGSRPLSVTASVSQAFSDASACLAAWQDTRGGVNLMCCEVEPRRSDDAPQPGAES